jgi:metallo-beta-lactamase class B
LFLAKSNVEAAMIDKIARLMQVVLITAAAIVGPGASLGWAQAANPAPADHPEITVHGLKFTPGSILARNMGTPEDQTTQFPPHKIIGNLYYVGTRTLSSFLIVTPQGDILINSTYERNVPTIEKSVEQLGFKFSDIKILLGTHAHSDHQEGDALMKQLTGAQTMAMAEDVPALQAMTPGGKEHPIDKTLHDGETVALGGTTLTAHLTPGHTRGCTTWTMKARESGKMYNVVIGCSLRPPATLTPNVVAEFSHTFPLVRSLACDVPLGDHPAQYNMREKYAKLRDSARNPFIDPDGCTYEVDIEEAMFHALLDEQQKAVGH